MLTSSDLRNLSRGGAQTGVRAGACRHPLTPPAMRARCLLRASDARTATLAETTC